ncbi:MAG: hypothetical protein NC935_03960 [Candidatus Omnitrophica bacterium]|nr:hypothetical protein [Candidatus Omnitrophota bacterium]
MKKIKWEKPVVKKISEDVKEEIIVKGDCMNGSLDMVCQSGQGAAEGCASGPAVPGGY